MTSRAMTRALNPWALFLAMILILLPLGAIAQQFSLPARTKRPLNPTDAFQIEILSTIGEEPSIGWQIADGYYLYRDQIRAKAADGTDIPVETPPGTVKDDPAFGSVEVYYDRATAILPGASGMVRVTWQGCQENGICYAPVTSDLVLPAGSTIASSSIVAEAEPPPEMQLQLSAEEGLIAGLAGRGGAAMVILAFFGFGLALAFTPCVLPMVPILAGMLTRQGESLTPRRGALLAGAYVLAMAGAFALLGAVAGWSGQNLQMAMQSPWAIWTIAALFVLLALSSFGLFDLQLPGGLARRISGLHGQRGSITGAAVLGFSSALIVGPCVTAPLAGALLYIAQTGDVLLGAGALFALGLGQGLPLFIAGTFGAHLLPRAGGWMEIMRRLFGVVFLGMAIWLMGRLLPEQMVLALWAILLAGSGVFLGGFDRLEPGAPVRLRLGRIGGIVALFMAALLGVGAATGAQDPLRPLDRLLASGDEARALTFIPAATPQALKSALADSPERPSLIYVTADWCTTCKVIDRKVLPDPGVVAALGDMRLIEADVTRLDGDGQALLDMIGAIGPPTMIFLDGKGKEKEGSRLVGPVSPEAVQNATLRIKGES